ncbi:MAG: hypothetical protein EHM41_07595 [Chloroflexi bacterium]|nr:MAG: hypothetical protein EHM41_07595 [Chloroflexota bacterium]
MKSSTYLLPRYLDDKKTTTTNRCGGLAVTKNWQPGAAYGGPCSVLTTTTLLTQAVSASSYSPTGNGSEFIVLA